ncbi:hypothetical protein SAMN04488505_10816 [Chitinophaga rupis]|uniref:Uncharacterized protein n=1 Tax=Chitinophaga rupis TaxID=573321 RepID=A0A1H8DJ93_9BACT|nr:hypothetical protein SAMN04488505_10816 [Chitinophaga rupis]
MLRLNMEHAEAILIKAEEYAKAGNLTEALMR